jgi:hypothetical protein
MVLTANVSPLRAAGAKALHSVRGGKKKNEENDCNQEYSRGGANEPPEQRARRCERGARKDAVQNFILKQAEGPIHK